MTKNTKPTKRRTPVESAGGRLLRAYLEKAAKKNESSVSSEVGGIGYRLNVAATTCWAWISGHHVPDLKSAIKLNEEAGIPFGAWFED